jgi:hypothetical protein
MNAVVKIGDLYVFDKRNQMYMVTDLRSNHHKNVKLINLVTKHEFWTPCDEFFRENLRKATKLERALK